MGTQEQYLNETHGVRYNILNDVNVDQAVLSLMAIAEKYRSAKIPRYKMAIKCALAAVKINCATELAALCNYELGKLLALYTRNTKLAKFHLKTAYNLMRDVGDPMELSRLKVVCMIAEINLADRCYEDIRALLRNEIADSRRHPFIHAKMLFLFSEVYLRMKDYDKALEVAISGIAYFRDIKEIIIECYFRLTKALILSIQMTNQEELGTTVSELSEILQDPATNSLPALNDIRAFCYSIQLCYFMSTGMLKSSKQCLRQLQMTVTAAEKIQESSEPHFYWLSSNLLTGLTYVLIVISNIQYSQFDRAHRYYANALHHFTNLKGLMLRNTWPVVERKHEELIAGLEMLLYESVAQTQLVLGCPQESLNIIGHMVQQAHNIPVLLMDFEAQIHTLLGMYSFYLRDPKNAETQLKAAIKKTKDRELLIMIHLSLALVYLFTAKESEFYELFDYISPNKLKSHATSIKSAAYLVQGIHFFLHMRTQECKTHLMDSMTFSKEEDMARLQAMALLLLNKLFKSKDMDLLKAAYEWTIKSNDRSLLIWANTEIINLNSATQQIFQSFNVQEANEHRETVESGRIACLQQPAHRLIEWSEGNIQSYL